MQLKVLAVDDTQTNLKIVSILVRKAGFDLLTASNGLEAVEMVRKEKPDIILMDVMMPVMDGIEATRIIKSEETGRWVPIVFLSALSSNEDLVGGLAAGGDDYLFKPINSVVLTAKLKTLARSLIGFREKEAETQLAMDILSRQLARAIVPGEAIDFWQMPAAGVSGDVVASAKAPDGTLYILLADATGHGLSASICTMPVLSLFYELVEWGLALPAIIQRINDQMNRFVPGTHFVALAALAIEPEAGFVDVWSGGIPDILVVDADGSVNTRISSRHMAVGICEMDNEDMTVERHQLGAGQQILMMSDGLCEAMNLAGECLGEARLEALLHGTDAENRMAAIKAGFAEFMGNAIPHDDVTVICVGPRQHCQNALTIPIFDRAGALARLGDDVELLQDILESFADEAQTDLAHLKAAVDGQQNDHARLHAHSIKGAASNVGALEIQELAARMEEAAKNGALDQIDEDLPELERRLAEFVFTTNAN